MICKATNMCEYYKKGKCLGIDCDCIALGTDTEHFIREMYESYDPDDYYRWL